MSKIFQRWLPAATLCVWSAVLLFFYFSGRIASFLHPSFRPGVLLAGCAMLALGCAFAFLPGVASCCDDEMCGHPLGRMSFGRVLTFLILLLPIGAAAFFSPENFGATTITNRGVITDASALVARVPAKASGKFAEPPLPSKDGSEAASPKDSQGEAPTTVAKTGPVKIEVIDLLYAAQDPSLRGDFENKKVELIGQLMPDNVSNASGKRFKLVRMLMTCCAADARPIAALAESEIKPDAAEMSWIKVVGTATFPFENGRMIAVLKADSVQRVDPPAEAMLY